jgi:site-specific DNA-methyltransferase (adenine-specific)
MPLLGKVDAVVTDPPYFGVKANDWDNQWANASEFVIWAGEISIAIQKLIITNGSLYWFCSPQMAARIEVKLSEKFRVLNNIVWDKANGRKGAAGSGIDVTSLRAYWSANTERIIFCENYGADTDAATIAGYNDSCVAAKKKIFGDYLLSEFRKAGASNKSVAALFPSKNGLLTGCVSNWVIGLNVPTRKQYQDMREFLGSLEYLKADYEYLKADYEDLKADYEDLRRTFNLNSSMEWGDVWKFQIERGQVHPTQKPISIINHIIRASTKSGQTILDPFMGSGTTLVACQKLGRKGIGIELDPDYFEIACKRVDEATRQPDLFVSDPDPQPTQGGLDL